MRLPTLAFLAVSAAAPFAFAAPQSKILLATGDVLPGGQEVIQILAATLDDDGNWAATAALAGGGTALVVNGVVLSGVPDPFPIAPLELLQSGEPLWIGDAAPGGGLFRGTDLLHVAPPPLTTFPWTTTWLRAARRGGVGETFLQSSVSGHLQSGSRIDRVLEDGQGGVIVVPLVELLGSLGIHSMDANSAGQVMVQTDSAVTIDGQVVFQNGPSPFFGQTWGPIGNGPVALNDAGQWAASGALSGGTRFILSSGFILVRSGDSLPAIAPHVLDHVTGPHEGLEMLADGRTVWMGRWTTSGGPRQGLFVDHALVVRTGMVVEGKALVDLHLAGMPQTPLFAVDSTGKRFLVRAGLDDGRVALVRIQPAGEITPLTGCPSNTVALNVAPAQVGPLVPGKAISTSILTLPTGTLGAFQFLSTQRLGDGPCGLQLAGMGDWLLSTDPAHLIGPISPSVLVPPFVCVFAPTVVPNLPALQGFRFYVQAAIVRDSPVQPVTFTTAAEVTMGHL